MTLKFSLGYVHECQLFIIKCLKAKKKKKNSIFKTKCPFFVMARGGDNLVVSRPKFSFKHRIALLLNHFLLIAFLKFVLLFCSLYLFIYLFREPASGEEGRRKRVRQS